LCGAHGVAVALRALPSAGAVFEGGCGGNVGEEDGGLLEAAEDFCAEVVAFRGGGEEGVERWSWIGLGGLEVFAELRA